MNILKRLSGMLFAVAVMALFGCGGGGGGTSQPGPAAQPTTATLKLLTQSATAGTKIRGIEVTVVLPQGVTVSAIPSTLNPALQETTAGVVTISGVADPAAFVQLKPTAIFTPATTTKPGTLFLSLPATADFNPGEFATVNTVIAAGSFPKVTDFGLTGFKAVDLNGAELTGVTANVVPDIK